MTAPVRFPRFFVTSPAPCPYLAGKTERKVFTELKGPHAEELNDALGRIGFRRSQTVAYRPSCLDCRACVSVRVVAREFAPSSAQRRTFRRNGDLVVGECRPWATAEQFELLQRYLVAAPSRAAAWRRWTRSITPTWWNTPPFPALSLNIGSPRWTGGRGAWSAPA